MQGPGDTPFEGGVYWGELDFPKDTADGFLAPRSAAGTNKNNKI